MQVSKGLGEVITQEGKLVAFGSKTLTTCERRYANIERERERERESCSLSSEEHFTNTCTGAE